jgi:hypothetical protein
MKTIKLTVLLLALTIGLAFSAGKQFYSTHITTNTTVTVVSTTCYLRSIAIGVPNAGTTWTLVIRNKEATPKTVYIASGTGGAVSTGTVGLSWDEPIIMTGGIDIVTSGGTPGVADVFLTYE